MDILTEALKSLRDLSSLERDVKNLRDDYVRIEDKIDTLINRISKLESDVSHLRKNVKNEILVELKEEIDRTKFNLEMHNRNQLDNKEED